MNGPTINLFPACSLCEPNELARLASSASAMMVAGVKASVQPVAQSALAPARQVAAAAGIEIEDRPRYARIGPVAVVPVVGFLAQETSLLAYYFGMMTSGDLVRAIDEANRDPAVREVCLHMDTPGGASAAADDAIEAIAGSVKPVSAYVVVAASLGCWISAYCHEIVAAPLAMGGSVGTVAEPVWDVSEKLEREGVRVHSVTTHKHKDLYAYGLPQSPEMVEHLREQFRGVSARFVGDLARLRGLSAEDIDAWDGAAFFGGDQLVARGLADRVSPAGAYYAELIARHGGASPAAVRVSGARAAAPATITTQAAVAAGVCAMTIDEFLTKYGIDTDEAREDLQGLVAQPEMEADPEMASEPEPEPEGSAPASVAALDRLAPASLHNRDNHILEAARRGLGEPEARVFFEGVARGQSSTPASAARHGREAPVNTGSRRGGEETAAAEVDRLVKARMEETGEPRHAAYIAVMKANRELLGRLEGSAA